MAEYYCGKWNDHTIVVENHTDREKLIVDDEILVETKSGLRFGSALTAPMSGTDDLYIYAMVTGFGCSCIVGKPLETEYDKKTKTYTAEYGGHVIEAINKSKAEITPFFHSRYCFIFLLQKSNGQLQYNFLWIWNP